MSALDDYLATSSQDKGALELKVKILLLLHRFNLAKQVAKTLLMLGGEEPPYLHLYGQALIAAGDLDGAEATLKRAYSLDPDSSYGFGSMVRQVRELSKLKKQGNDFVSQGKTNEAIEEYTKVDILRLIKNRESKNVLLRNFYVVISF